MFDDWNWQSSRTELQEHRLETWLEKVTKLVVIEIGAGTAILTVRRKGEALRGQLIRINPHESRVGRANAVGITGGALSTLKLLQAELSSSPN